MRCPSQSSAAEELLDAATLAARAELKKAIIGEKGDPEAFANTYTARAIARRAAKAAAAGRCRSADRAIDDGWRLLGHSRRL